MRNPSRRTYLRFLAIFSLLGAIGLASVAYVLLQQGARVPFRDTQRVHVEFANADGLVSGIGQPVNVVGVQVGQVVDARVVDGRARLELELERDEVPRLYADASATLEPITPLEDLQIELHPGAPPAEPLPEGATIGVARTSEPVPASDLLSALDTDTRTFLSSLIASLDQGTRGRATDLRPALVALGPTTAQVGRITRALEKRRHALARLVHNLAVVTRAASRDGRLAEMVSAGETTLQALAEQDAPLRAAITKLPGTLETTRSTLRALEPFSRRLRPALSSLLPSVQRLPATFADLRPFARTGRRTLRRDLRPLIAQAQPLARELGPAVLALDDMTPDLSRSFQVLTYLTNELAYNPPGDDEGFMFWASWFFHNTNSMLSSGDAHGGIGRAAPIVECEGLQGVKELQPGFAALGVCPE